jgi:hypothetical protein
LKTNALILLYLIFLLPIACKKEKHYPANILIGNTSTKEITYYDVNPDTLLQSRHDTAFYKIDINGDQIDDFEFILHNDYIFGGTVLANGVLNIRTLSDNAYVLSDSSMKADALSYSDTLKNSNNFRTGLFLLYSTHCSIPPTNVCSSMGQWDNIDKKYIGIRLKNDRLGWIKIGVTQDILLKVYEYGIIRD